MRVYISPDCPSVFIVSTLKFSDGPEAKDGPAGNVLPTQTEYFADHKIFQKQTPNVFFGLGFGPLVLFGLQFDLPSFFVLDFDPLEKKVSHPWLIKLRVSRLC